MSLPKTFEELYKIQKQKFFAKNEIKIMVRKIATEMSSLFTDLKNEIIEKENEMILKVVSKKGVLYGDINVTSVNYEDLIVNPRELEEIKNFDDKKDKLFVLCLNQMGFEPKLHFDEEEGVYVVILDKFDNGDLNVYLAITPLLD